MAETQKKAVLGVCAWRFIEPDTNRCLISALLTGRYIAMEQWNDAAIDRARGCAATEFLRHTSPDDTDVLVFIDSDMIFSLEDLDKIVSLARDKVGIAIGAYPVRRGDAPWLALVPLEGNAVLSFNAESPPIEVKYGATGFMAIHREVLKAVADTMPLCTGAGAPFWPVFLPLIVDENGTNHYLSEDWSFCHRARDLGFPVWLDQTVKLGHIGNYVYSVKDLMQAQDTSSDREAVVGDLAGYLEKDPWEVVSLLRDENMVPIWDKRAAVWRKMDPDGPDSVSAYYRRDDIDSVLDLAQLNSQPAYWQSAASLLRCSGKVVDFGGGIGSITLALARRGVAVTYVDLPSPQRTFAEWRFKKHGFASVQVASNLEGLADQDYVVSIDTIEHIHPKALPKLAKQLYAVLREGGECLTINDFGRGSNSGLPMHYDTEAEFGAAMADAGFTGGPRHWLKPYRTGVR